MSVDISKIQDIKEDLDNLKENDVLFVDEDGETKYAILPIDLYDSIEDLLEYIDLYSYPQVNFINKDNYELTYDEYERIKKQIMDAIERTLMPKPEKLN